MDRQLVDPREKSSVCSTMSSILNHVSVIDLQSLVTIIAILYYTKMEKKRKKKLFFYPASLEGQLSHADFYKRPFQSLADSTSPSSSERRG